MPRSAQLPWAGEGLHVCYSKRGLHGVPERATHILLLSPCWALAFTPSCQANISGKSCVTD